MNTHLSELRMTIDKKWVASSLESLFLQLLQLFLKINKTNQYVSKYVIKKHGNLNQLHCYLIYFPVIILAKIMLTFFKDLQPRQHDKSE